MDKLRHSRRRGRGRCRLGCLLTRLFPRALLARARSEAEVKLGTKMRVNVWEGRQTMPGRMGRGGGVGGPLSAARTHPLWCVPPRMCMVYADHMHMRTSAASRAS